ncbi:MAG: hypothetical protein QOI59_983 [Gammaproteobacteria bacterium]|nr:hypothetical protein [Gammaproteobacteria bacterium]
MTRRTGGWFAALLPIACMHGYVFAATGGDPVADLSRCAAVADRDERLTCYDGLATRYGRPAKAAATTANKVSATEAAPIAAPASASTAAASAPAARAPAPAPAFAPATVAKGPAVESKADFGLTAAQRRKESDEPAKAQAIDGVVTGFGMSSNGRPLVRLDNAQAWELDQADPLLSVGDKVIIRRATLGSFLLTTPTKRVHRVRRLS